MILEGLIIVGILFLSGGGVYVYDKHKKMIHTRTDAIYDGKRETIETNKHYSMDDLEKYEEKIYYMSLDSQSISALMVPIALSIIDLSDNTEIFYIRIKTSHR